jgi:hypothetical protein
MIKRLIEKLKTLRLYFVRRSEWLIASIDENSTLGYKFSVNYTAGASEVTSDVWNVEKGWIKWRIKGYNYKQIDALKDAIIKSSLNPLEDKP